MTRIRITAAYALTFENGDHALLRDAEVIVEGTTIASVGHATDAPVDETIALGNVVLMPGLIDLDALTDIDHAIIDSWHPAERSAGLQWSKEYADTRREHVFDAEERAFIRRFGFVQLLLHGITSAMPIASEVHSEWAETFDDAVGMAQTASELGLRVFLGPSYRSGVTVVDSDGERGIAWNDELGEQGFRDAVDFVAWTRELDDDLITGVLLPCRIETLTEELMRQTAMAAEQLNVKIRLHAMQGGLERKLILQRHGVSPIELLRRNGLLTQRLLVPHATYVDTYSKVTAEPSDDIGQLARAGVAIIHCPLTSARYGSALETFDSYIDAGVTVSLGTDSFPPDMIRGIDIGMCLAKIIEGRLDAGSPARYIRAATLGGAAALGRPDLGRIEAGATADIVAMSLDDFRDGIIDDPVRTLIAHSTARATVFSMINGTTIVRDGEIPGIDMRAMRDRAQLLFERMKGAYSGRDYRLRTTEELFPSVFSASEG